MCLTVSDRDEAVRLWRDVLGFELTMFHDLPNVSTPEKKALMPKEVLDDIFKVEGATSKMAWLRSSGGAQIEIQQSTNPKIQRTPPETLGHAHTGVHELCLEVENIDYWFDRVRAEGYETNTDYVWSLGDVARSFLFYDADGNMIQLIENNPPAATS